MARLPEDTHAPPDAELNFFGFPPRPTTSAAMASWHDQFSAANYDGVVALAGNGAVCATAESPVTTSSGSLDTNPDDQDVNDVTVTVEKSPNWAGIVDDSSGGYDYVYGKASLPNTMSYCAGSDPSSYASWVGIGGFGLSKPLIQNGVSSGGPDGGPLAPYIWTAVLQGRTGPSAYFPISSSQFKVAQGDTISMSTHYVTTPARYVSFYFHDFTQGEVLDLVLTGKDNTQVDNPDQLAPGNIKDYYDGDTAEVINEREYNGSTDKYTELRNHTLTTWTGAAASTGAASDAKPIRTVDRIRLDMHNVAFTNELENVASGSSTSDFTSKHLDCGARATRASCSSSSLTPRRPARWDGSTAGAPRTARSTPNSAVVRRAALPSPVRPTTTPHAGTSPLVADIGCWCGSPPVAAWRSTTSRSEVRRTRPSASSCSAASTGANPPLRQAHTWKLFCWVRPTRACATAESAPLCTSR